MRTSALLLSVTLGGCGWLWAPPFPSGDASGSISSGVASFDIVRYTNDVRLDMGRPLLQTSPRLMEAARIQAEQMATYDRLDHTIYGAKYPTIPSRLKAVGYDFEYAGENIIAHEPNAIRAVQAWMNSDAHRGNIIDLGYTEMGAAFAQSASGENYFVQVFGKPRATVALVRK